MNDSKRAGLAEELFQLRDRLISEAEELQGIAERLGRQRPSPWRIPELHLRLVADSVHLLAVAETQRGRRAEPLPENRKPAPHRDRDLGIFLEVFARGLRSSEGRTFRAIGDEHGISGSRVRQILDRSWREAARTLRNRTFSGDPAWRDRKR